MDHSNPNQTKKHSTVLNKILSKAPFLLFTFFLCNIIPLIYVSNEHVIYSWDQTAYHDMAIQKALEFREMSLSLSGVHDQLSKIYASTVKNYNDYYTVIIAPLLLLFGASRTLFILFLAWFYLFPFILTLGAICSSIVTSNKTIAFRIGVLLSIFTPAVWLPTLNGYPDAGAAFLISLAILLFTQNIALKSVWRLFAMGACLALAVLFRRHFAYDVITFFIAVSFIQLYQVFNIKATASAQIKILVSRALQVSIIGVFTVIVVCVLGWPFIKRLMYTNYSEIYASYERTNLTNATYYLTYYGWIMVAISIIGYVITLIGKSGIRGGAALFLLIAGFYSTLQWFLKVKQLGVHYTLHFTPWIVLGVFMALWYSLYSLKKYRWPVSIGIVSFSALIFIITLFPLPTAKAFANNSYIPTTGLHLQPFPNNYPPVKQPNYEEVLQLYNYFKSVATSNDPIYVAASSGVLNDDMLWHAHPNFYKTMMASSSAANFWKGYQLNVQHWIPFVDSYDNYPLQELQKSSYVVVTKPFQHHLPIDQQKVIHVVVKCFEEGWPFSKDFELVPRSFNMGNGVTAFVYKRIRPTSLPTLLFTYKQMKTYINPPPGGKLNWIGLNKNGYFFSVGQDKQTYQIAIENVASQPISFIYLGSDSIENKTAKGSIYFPTSTNAFAVSLNFLDLNGNIVSKQEQNFTSNQGTFEILLDHGSKDYSFINLTFSAKKKDNTNLRENEWISIKGLQIK